MASKFYLVVLLLQVSTGALAQHRLRTAPHSPSPNAHGIFSRQDFVCPPGDSLCPNGTGCCPTGVACITDAGGPACDLPCPSSEATCFGGCCEAGYNCDAVSRICIKSVGGGGGSIPSISISSRTVTFSSFTISSYTISSISIPTFSTPTLAPVPGIATTSTSSSTSTGTPLKPANTSTSSSSTTTTSSTTQAGPSPDSTSSVPSNNSSPTSTAGDVGKPAPNGTFGGATPPVVEANSAAGGSMGVGGLLLGAMGVAICQAVNLAL